MTRTSMKPWQRWGMAFLLYLLGWAVRWEHTTLFPTPTPQQQEIKYDSAGEPVENH